MSKTSHITVTITGFLLAFLSLVFSANAQQNQLQWHDFEEAIAIASETQKPIFVDVWAPWCGWCRKMKKEVYPKLETELDEYVLTRLNREDNGSSISYLNQTLSPLKLAQKLNINTVPGMIILSSEGNYLLHLTGFTEEQSLEPILNYVATQSYKDLTFEEFVQGKK